jgi:NitT/TauT family transport system substrate-binding protein
MFRRASLISILAFILGIALSCTSSNEHTDAANAMTTDSTSLRVAILPIQECEVLRYAQESGLTREMGLSLKLIPFDAMMDVDTAVLSRVAHVYFEDSLRICRIQQDSLRPTMLLPIPVKVSLIAHKQKDITNIKSLKTYMVGITRWSQLEEWLTLMTDTSGLEQMDVFHAQVNSIPLRFNMINGGLIDAAILPMPWADSLTTKLGHTIIEEDILQGMGFFISPSASADSLRVSQASLLKKVYLEALSRLTSTHD